MPGFSTPGWRLLELIELCELPRLPSELLRMAEAGYGPEAQIAFDRYAWGRVARFRRMMEETVEQDAPPRRRAKAKVRVPRYSEAELLAALDVDLEDEVARDIVQAAIAESEWDAIAWEEEDEDAVAALGLSD